MFVSITSHYVIFFFFFFNDTATTEIYTLSLHDALPICQRSVGDNSQQQDMKSIMPRSHGLLICAFVKASLLMGDRKSTRLNSSHLVISYAVFCLKKKKITSTYLP